MFLSGPWPVADTHDAFACVAARAREKERERERERKLACASRHAKSSGATLDLIGKYTREMREKERGKEKDDGINFR